MNASVRSALLGAGALSSGVALTATSGWLIVRAGERPVILTLMIAIVCVRAFGMARPVLRHLERLTGHDDALSRLVGARTSTYAALVPLTPARLGSRRRGSMLTAVVDDVTEVVESGVRATGPMASVVLTGALAAAISAAIHPAAGLVVAVLVAVAAGVAVLAHRLEARGQDALGAARAAAADVAELVAAQAGPLRAIGGSSWARDRLDAAQARVVTLLARQVRGRAMAAAVPLPLAGLGALAVALVTRDAGLSTPVVAGLVLVPVALAEPLGLLPEAARALARAGGARRRLDGMLHQPPAVADRPGVATRLLAPVPRLELDGVTASWDGVRPALGPLDLVVEPGTRLAVTGPSGCGKSTLVAVLARQLETTGRYAVDGRSVTDLPVEQVRGLVAIVDDEPHVFASSLRENLRLARPEASDAEVVVALDWAGLRTWRRGLPDGLDTVLGAGARGVSGGERARLSIARALLSGRPILLLDEPLAHLDHATAASVLDDLLAAAGPRTVIVVSHRPDGLDRFDRVLELDHARRTPTLKVG